MFRAVVPEVVLHLFRLSPKSAEYGRKTSVFFEPAAHIDALAFKVAHRADFFLFRPPRRAVQIGVGTQFLLETEPKSDNEKLREQKKSLAVSNGLINKTEGITCPEPFLPDKGRPRGIPGKAEGDSPRLAECCLIIEKRRYALGCHNHAAKTEQQHERQIEPAQWRFLRGFLPQTVLNFFRAHDVLL